MKILNISKIDNCVESQNAHDIYFTDLISEEFIDKFSDMGKVVYSSINNKKYFRIIVKGKFTLKGFVNNSDFRLLIADNLGSNFIEEIKEEINKRL